MQKQETNAARHALSVGHKSILSNRFFKFLIFGLSLSMLATVIPAQARSTEEKSGKPNKSAAMVKAQKSIGKRIAHSGRGSGATANSGRKSPPSLVGKASVKHAGKAGGKDASHLASKATRKRGAGSLASGGRASNRKFASARHMGKRGRFHTVAMAPRVIEPARPSIGQAIGLHSVEDPLALRSSVALVADAQTGQVLYEKNGGAVLPIASITKLMTAMVVLDSKANLKEVLEVTEGDRDHERNSRSRLPMGSRLTRLELMNLALMASENRAASALGRNHPGGEALFVTEMNAKARAIGLIDTHFTEGTGLSSANVSTARDLAKMVQAASRYPLIRELSTASELNVDLAGRTVTFRNTNRLVGAESWGVVLQKTGYISEAGQCLVMMANWSERPVIMVFLDSAGRYSRLADAQRVRDWLDAKAVQSRVDAKPSQSRAALHSRPS